MSAGNRAPAPPEDLGQTESTIPCPSCDKLAPFVSIPGGSGKTVQCPVCGPVRVIDIDDWDDDVSFLPAGAPEPEEAITAKPASSGARSSFLSPLAIRGAGAVLVGLFGLVTYQTLIARSPSTETDLSRVEAPSSIEAPLKADAPAAVAPLELSTSAAAPGDTASGATAAPSEPLPLVAGPAEPMAAPAVPEIVTSLSALTAAAPAKPVSPAVAASDLPKPYAKAVPAESQASAPRSAPADSAVVAPRAAPAESPVEAPRAVPPAEAPVTLSANAKPATAAPAPRAEVPVVAPAKVQVAAIQAPEPVAAKPAPPEAAKGADRRQDEAAASKTAEGDLPNGAVAPKPLESNPAPRYPQMARRVGKAGVVVLRILVTAEGSVTDIKVLEGEEPFVGAAVKAVRKWRYEPAQHQGRAIGVYRTIRLGFALDS